MSKVLFLHILKCGGTSMLYSLYRQHGNNGFYPVQVGQTTKELFFPHIRGTDPLQWFRYLDMNTIDCYSCIAGHYDWHMAEKLPHWQLITLLRHPVAQLKSLYQYMAREKQDFERAKYLQAIGFDAWLISEDIKPYLNNQTRYLSGHDVYNLAVAIQNLQAPRLSYGIVERYSESIQLFNQKFGWSLQENRCNVSPNVLELSKDVYQEVVKLQVADMQLYQYALEHFEEQFDDHHKSAD